MRRPQRLIVAAVLIAFSGALAGCSTGFGSSFDPSDLLDFLDTKKKLPGDRKPVFPDGVPGLEQGVPKDLYKGAQQDQPPPQQQNAEVAPANPAAPPSEEPKSKQASKSKGKGKQPAATAAAPAAAEDPASEPNGETVPEEEATPAAPPPPKPAKKLVRRRTTAPPPDQSAATQSQPAQQSQAPFPAPMPAGTFTR
jgi:hypothetical protein